MNHLTIIGNLCSDPELRTTTSGKQVCNFRVAVNRRRGSQQGTSPAQGQPEADFFSVSAWNTLAENCGRYLTKGRKVCVVGSVGISTYKTRDGVDRASLEVMASEVEFLTPASAAPEPAQPNSGTSHAAGGYVEVTDGELPF